MSSRGPYRRHAPQFKIQLCQDIRSGAIGRRDAAKKYTLSTNLIQLWLTQYDRGELSTEEAEASVIAEYEAKGLSNESPKATAPGSTAQGRDETAPRAPIATTRWPRLRRSEWLIAANFNSLLVAKENAECPNSRVAAMLR